MMQQTILAIIAASTTLLLLLSDNVDAFVPNTQPTSSWGIVQSRTNQQEDPIPSTIPLHCLRPTIDGRRRAFAVQITLQAGLRGSSDDDGPPVKIIIAGAPASGKGTQCEKIQETFGVVHLSTGDMLRAAVAAKTPVGLEAQSYMDSGKLVPDSTIIGVVKDRLEEDDCQKQGWLLDGFPRTQAQAKALEDAGIQADCFLFLNVPDEVLVERVVGRRTDPETGKIYHMTFSPPPEEIKDRLVHRSDDTEEKVKVRLEQFHTNVDAVKDCYTDISITVNGNQDPKVVSEKIMDGIESMVATVK